jgi:hypothetical protein
MAANLKSKKTDFYITMGAAIIAFLACVFVSVGGSFVTFAWFTQNRAASVGVNNLVANSNDTVSKVEVFPYDSTATQTTGVFTFGKTATNTLGHYSLLKQTENAVLFKVTLTDYGAKAASLTLYAHSDATSWLGELDSTGAAKTLLASTGNSLSSIVCFYAFSSITGDDSTSTNYSVTLANSLTPEHKALNFVSNSKLVNGVTLGTTTSAVSTVYFVLDYDVALIESIYSANIGNPAISNIGGNATSSSSGGDGQTYVDYTADFNFWIAAN